MIEAITCTNDRVLDDNDQLTEFTALTDLIFDKSLKQWDRHKLVGLVIIESPP